MASTCASESEMVLFVPKSFDVMGTASPNNSYAFVPTFAHNWMEPFFNVVSFAATGT